MSPEPVIELVRGRLTDEVAKELLAFWRAERVVAGAAAWGGASVRGVGEHVFVMRDLTNNQKGAAAEAVIAAEAMKVGVDVYRPLSSHARADLIFEVGDCISRIQVKSGRVGRDGSVVVIHTNGSYLTPNGYRHSTYSGREIDFIASYVPELDRCFLLPPSIFAGKHQVQLRLAPSRNNQRACINLADDFGFSGAVAQLEERRHGMAEARGSSPLSSIPSVPPPATVLGCEAVRDRLGQVIERVAAGEEIVVTRRGKPRLRMSPVHAASPHARITTMSDQSITDHIEALVAEEQRLEAHETADAADDATLAADRERLAQIKVELDQTWDLLRRRRALREAGADPDSAALRDASTVEGYQQ